jgi:hypothetical protein
VLDSVECFVVCGHALSAATFDAVAQKVGEGATCIIARRLYDLHSPEKKTLPGKWVILDRFDSPELAEALQPFLGPENEARYRFANGTVIFKKGTAPDTVETEGL